MPTVRQIGAPGGVWHSKIHTRIERYHGGRGRPKLADSTTDWGPLPVRLFHPPTPRIRSHFCSSGSRLQPRVNYNLSRLRRRGRGCVAHHMRKHVSRKLTKNISRKTGVTVKLANAVVKSIAALGAAHLKEFDKFCFRGLFVVQVQRSPFRSRFYSIPSQPTASLPTLHWKRIIATPSQVLKQRMSPPPSGGS